MRLLSKLMKKYHSSDEPTYKLHDYELEIIFEFGKACLEASTEREYMEMSALIGRLLKEDCLSHEAAMWLTKHVYNNRRNDGHYNDRHCDYKPDLYTGVPC